jgi:methyl-accepting chemotaxis protein
MRSTAATPEVRWLKTRLNLWRGGLASLTEPSLAGLPLARTAVEAWRGSIAELRRAGVSEQLQGILDEVHEMTCDLRGFADSAQEQQQRILMVAGIAADGIAPVSQQVENCERIERAATSSMDQMTRELGKVFDREISDQRLLKLVDELGRVASRY